MEIIANVQNLCKSYGQSEILKNCCLTLNKGEIYSILGVNGAGKTTLMKLLLGLQKPDSGTICVFGKNIAERNSYLSDIGSMIEFPTFYEHLGAEKNLEIHLSYLQKKANISNIIQKVGLSEAAGKPVSQYSLGMKQRLGIARAIIHAPKLLILDEPMNGLDPVAITEMRTLLLSLALEGITILLSSHIISEVLNTSDKIGVMTGGRISEEFSVREKTPEYREKLETQIIKILKEDSHGMDET